MSLPLPSAEDIRHQVARILASEGFSRNTRLSGFLQYIVERHLDGRTGEIKESLIAVDVFGRPPGYDPKQDSVVRTEAARLRARLHEYYFEAAGREDEVVIEVPKGGYLPAFRRRERPGAPVTDPPRRLPVLAGVAAAAAAVLVVALTLWTTQAEGGPIRMAVLPLEHVGSDPEGQFFADGLTDEIIRHLSMIEGLDVRSRTSSFVFKGRPRNVREAGRALQVDYLLEGSVLRGDGHARINAHLVRVEDDTSVWSVRFDRPLEDLLAVQDELSLGIVNHLRMALGAGRRRYEISVEAYDWYLRARAVSHGGRGTPFGDSIRLYEQAIAIDPRLAPAHAGLAAAMAKSSTNFAGERFRPEMDRIRTTAQRAIELDPLLAEAHGALALVFAREARWAEAEASFQRALMLDRTLSSTSVDYAMWMLYVLGRAEEAYAHLMRALQVDPLAPEVHQPLAWVLLSLGRPDEAREFCERLPGGHGFKRQCLARVMLAQGGVGEAIEMLVGDPDPDPQARGFLGYAYARAGRRAEAEAMAEASNAANERALIFAGLGDKGRTLRALEDMADSGPQRIGRYLEYPEFSLLRNDPRVTELRRAVGLCRGVAAASEGISFLSRCNDGTP